MIERPGIVGSDMRSHHLLYTAFVWGCTCTSANTACLDVTDKFPGEMTINCKLDSSGRKP
jgi:hypothetical protein